MPHIFENIELELLASSTFVIGGALSSISARLRARLEKDRPAKSLEDGPDQGYEALNEMTLQGVKA